MKGRMMGPLTAGMMIGVAASLMVLPQLDGRTRRKICKTSRKLASNAENIFHDLTEH